MVTLDELKQKYHSDLVDKLARLEPLRRKVLFSDLLILILIVVPIIYVVAIFVSLDKNAPITEVATPFILLAVMVTAAIIIRYVTKSSRMMLHEQRQLLVVEAIDPSWHFEAKGCIPEQEYINAELSEQKLFKYSGSDLVTGILKGAQFSGSKFIDISKAHSTKKYITTRGFLLTADVENTVQGKVFIDINIPNLMLGGLGESIFGRKSEQRITMGNPEFDKHFMVYATSQDEAFRIVNQPIMEALLLFRKQSQYIYPVTVSFIGSKIYCAIMFDRDPLLFGSYSSVLKFKTLELWHSIFTLYGNVIREFSLDSKRF
ncbi:MAG: DUF3137 domain-containing protein [Bacteroidales bacterium]